MSKKELDKKKEKKTVDHWYGIIQPTEKTLQSYKLNYFIKQLVIFLIRSDSWRQYGTYVR